MKIGFSERELKLFHEMLKKMDIDFRVKNEKRIITVNEDFILEKMEELRKKIFLTKIKASHLDDHIKEIIRHIKI